MFPSVDCPNCSSAFSGPFPKSGCPCGFTLSGLVGLGTSNFQIKKDPQHRDILYGRDIQLFGKPMNASFDHYGETNLIDIVDYAITWGERRTIRSLHGSHNTNVIVSYIPNILGSGITKSDMATPIGCSGICLMCPESTGGYEHSFAVLDIWVASKFAGDASMCKVCGITTPFGLNICGECFARNGNIWQNFIDPGYRIVL